MVLKGKTSIKKFLVSDPWYDSKVKCRLSKQLPKKFQWDLEIHIRRRTETLYEREFVMMDIAFYIGRFSEHEEHQMFSRTSVDSFTHMGGMMKTHSIIGVDTATLNINDVSIRTMSDGQYGEYNVYTSKQYLNYDKGLAGIHCVITLDEECSTSHGWDVTNEDHLKEMFEHIFETKLEVVEQSKGVENE